MNKRNFLIVLKWGAIMGVGLGVVDYLREYTATIDFYPFAPVLDLLMILVFIGCLYAGIKEYRDALQNQFIKFTRAFLAGGEITLVAMVLFFIYLLVNISAFDQNSVEKINAKNNAKYFNKIKNDTISRQNISTYIDASFGIIDNQKEIIFHAANPDSSCIALATNAIDSLKISFKKNLLSIYLADTAKSLASFDEYSSRNFTTLSGKYGNLDDSTQTPCISTLTSIFSNSAKEMAKVTPLQIKYQEGLSKVIHFRNEISAAFFLSIPVLIYGLLFNLFVAFFLFRKKKEKNENEPLSDRQEDNQNIENK